jgi:hypothetical protein
MDILWEVSMEQSVSSKRSRKWPTLSGDREESALEVARLAALDVPALRQRWVALFGDDPSPNLGRALLLRAIAYRPQEKASPSLKPSTQRVLDRIADNPMMNHQFCEPSRTGIPIHESRLYFTRHAPGAAAFNRKPKVLQRLQPW